MNTESTITFDNLRPEVRRFLAHRYTLQLSSRWQYLNQTPVRVNKLDFYAFIFGFVGDKCLELSETPSMQPAALSLSRLGSTANIREVFKNL